MYCRSGSDRDIVCVVDKRRYGGVCRFEKASFFAARLGISGCLDDSVYPHGNRFFSGSKQRKGESESQGRALFLFAAAVREFSLVFLFLLSEMVSLFVLLGYSFMDPDRENDSGIPESICGSGLSDASLFFVGNICRNFKSGDYTDGVLGAKVRKERGFVYI